MQVASEAPYIRISKHSFNDTQVVRNGVLKSGSTGHSAQPHGFCSCTLLGATLYST